MSSGSPLRLRIKVIPNAPRSQICGWLGSQLKIKVHAPPVHGRANEEVCRILAEALTLPTRDVSIVGGETSRHKAVQIEGLTLETLQVRLGLP